MTNSKMFQIILDYGRNVFGSDFPLRSEERLPWLNARAEQGCPLATRLLNQRTPVPVHKRPSSGSDTLQRKHKIE